MATFTQQIVSTASDGYSTGGTWDPSPARILQGFGGGGVETAGFRFSGVTIPQGAFISSATLTLIRTGIAQTGSSWGSILGDAVDNAATWSTGSRPDNITPTAASTPYLSGAPSAVLVHNVTAIVQEIISRPGWSSGNALRFGSSGSTSGNETNFYDVGTNSANAATLSITYSTPTNYTQSITASATFSASLRKSYGRTVAATLSSAATLRRAIGKSITASFTAVSSLNAGKRALASVTASFSSTATMTRAVGHAVFVTITASFVSVASLTARLRANVSISAQVVPQVSISAGKAFRRTIAVAAPFSAFVGRIYAVTISAAFTGITSLFHASQSAPPPERLIQLGTQNRIIDLPAAANRIIEL